MKRDIFNTTSFLSCCILLTVYVVMGLVDGTPDILSILYAIALWELYGTSRSGKELSGFGLAVGTAKAAWIIGWILTGILTVIGLLLMFLPHSLLNSAIDYSLDITAPGADDMVDSAVHFLGQYGLIWVGVALLLFAVLIVVFNVFYTKRLYVFFTSLKDCMDKPEWFPEETEPLRKWLMVLGILGCLGLAASIGSAGDGFQSVCIGACLIVGSFWIRDLSEHRIEKVAFDNASYDAESWYR